MSCSVNSAKPHQECAVENERKVTLASDWLAQDATDRSSAFLEHLLTADILFLAW